MSPTLDEPIETKVGCVQSAAEIVGNKWTALILKDLANCPTGFCSLQKSVEGINPRVLSQRLDQLESSKIILKKLDTAGRPNYRLTKKGQDLIPVLKSMASWGAKYSAC